MAAEEILKLFETFWSEKSIFTRQKPSLLASPRQEPDTTVRETQEKEDQEKSREPKKRNLPSLTLHVTRSRSYQNLLMSSKTSFFGFSDDISSADSVLNAATTPKLQTIFSGKEVSDCSSDGVSLRPEREFLVEETQNSHEVRKTRRKRKGVGSSKSLSDLEYEELKGFMDLGFVFSEEDHKDSNLVSIIPGLQRLGRRDEHHEEEEEEEEEEERRQKDLVSRPYLSEAWWGVWKERKGEKRVSINWRVQAQGNEVDMKDHLRLWAHTVASTVR